jgi:nitrogen fixation/metabolism regulation signal transduction histidine kinase
MQDIQSELEEKEMTSWQTLIRVLTHEIMNSITPIASLTSFAYGLLKNNQECEVPESMNEFMGDVLDAVNTIEKRSKGLLDFIENYRKLTWIPKPDFNIVQVKNLLDRVGNLMKDQLEYQAIDFSLRADPETLEITADQALIEQILINICKTSVEAVNSIGNLIIELTAGTDGLGNPVVKVIDNGNG